MPANTTLSRVNTVDFFAVIIPGIYFAVNLAFLGFAFIDRAKVQKTPWQIISEAIAGVPVNGVLVLILGSLLLGSLARAFSVNTVDILSGKLNRVVRRSRHRKKHYSHDFPYNSMLETMLRLLEKSHKFKPQCKPPSPEAHVLERSGVFNYWKTVICKESSELFGFIRAAEARVRMFAGIVWATGWSCVVAILALTCPALRAWYEPFVVALLISLTLCLVFIVLLRPMRHEEARAVYLAFLALHREDEV